MDRQEIIASNKSLRLIKNELEHLLEKGVIADDVFESIHRLLPSESSLSSAATPAARAAAALPSPPVKAMANLNVAPPAYNATGPPALPVRNNPPPPPAAPVKPVVAHAVARYRYAASDDRDLSFERDDRIEVHEFMNDHWWMGRNTRTGADGIFPHNHVERVDENSMNEKQGYHAPQQPVYASPSPANGAYPPPPQAQNPYNANVPPMAVASQGSQGGAGGLASNSKVNENGKKFGKKLGNAAIFGAGASIGGKIVNGIF
ncbi:SH3-domain-containing protein [Xylariaceae sp. FL0804]|nr:SH3-domain-containing protein [Xylariaceae sp. FL0804]